MTEENNLAAGAVEAEGVAPEAATEAPKIETAQADTAPETESENTDNRDDTRRNRRTAPERIAQLTRQKRELEEEVARLRKSAEKPPREEDFPDYAEFERAKVKHAAREALADERQTLAETQAQRIAETVQAEWLDRVTEFKAKAPDFDAVVNRADLPINKPMADALMLMDEGPSLAYHLGKNPHEAHRLSTLPPALAVAEMGRMAERLKAPPRRTVSSAPPPVTPVVGAGGPSEPDPAKETYAQYRARRLREMHGE